MDKNKNTALRDPGAWNPYVAGALSGLVSVFSVWIAGKYLGASTSFVRTAGLIEELFSAERVAQMEYFIKTVPRIYQVNFFRGSCLSC